MSIAGWFRKIFGPDRQAILNAAIARAAQLAGEMEEAAYRRDSYAELVARVNPHEDWWLFAQRRQRLQDAREDHLDLQVAYERACKDVDALIQAAQ